MPVISANNRSRCGHAGGGGGEGGGGAVAVGWQLSWLPQCHLSVTKRNHDGQACNWDRSGTCSILHLQIARIETGVQLKAYLRYY